MIPLHMYSILHSAYNLVIKWIIVQIYYYTLLRPRQLSTMAFCKLIFTLIIVKTHNILYIFNEFQALNCTTYLKTLLQLWWRYAVHILRKFCSCNGLQAVLCVEDVLYVVPAVLVPPLHGQVQVGEEALLAHHPPASRPVPDTVTHLHTHTVTHQH